MDIFCPPKDIGEFISYDPQTGKLAWRKYAGGNSRAGRELSSISSDGYIRVNFRGVEYKAHNLAWFFVTGEWPRSLLDHENLITTDNRFSNLREADRSSNAANTRKKSGTSSKFKGVTWNARVGKWQAQIKIRGKSSYLGIYENEEDAHLAYAAAAQRGFGQFARLA